MPGGGPIQDMLSTTSKTSNPRKRRPRHKGTSTAGDGSRARATETEMPQRESNPRSSGREASKAPRGSPVQKRHATQVRRPKSASGTPSSKVKSPAKTRPSSSASHRVNAQKPTEQTKAKSDTAANNVKRSSGFMDALFGNRNSATGKKITCVTCLSDDVPISRSAKLACSHRMCYGCLKRIFIMSVSDPQHMPPRCCTSDHIPLQHVDKLFDSKFKGQWNKKYQEYMTQNRLYCPARGCGEWIRPNNIHHDLHSANRRYGKCPRCKTRVCVKCNRKWHRARDCPRDEGTQRFVEVAEQEGWQKCFNCSAMVELKEGCNHMTCRCTAEFCMLCGKKWKTCDCPWFNYENMDGEVLNQMNIPDARRNQLRRQMEVERRQEQERQDEEFARRLERGLSLDDHPLNDDDDGGHPDGQQPHEFNDVDGSRAPRAPFVQGAEGRPRRRAQGIRPASPIQDAEIEVGDARYTFSRPHRSSRRHSSMMSPFMSESSRRRRRRDGS